jgi:hypothetical protein
LGIISFIKNKYPVEHHCTDNGCTLKLKGLNLNDIAILKGEDIRGEVDNQEICDRIIFQENSHIMIALIELKNEDRPKATKIIGQLNGGLKYAFKIYDDYNVRSIKPDVILIALVMGINKRYDREELRKPIKFKGKKLFIVVGRCGDNYLDIVTKYKKLVTPIF